MVCSRISDIKYLDANEQLNEIYAASCLGIFNTKIVLDLSSAKHSEGNVIVSI